MTKIQQSTIFFLFCLFLMPSIYAQTEIVSERSMNSKTYELLDGQKQAVLSMEPIHYLTSGNWEPISSELVPAATGGFENLTNVIKTSFPNQIATNKFVRLELQTGEVINVQAVKEMVAYDNGTMSVLSTTPFASPASASQSTVNYSNIYAGISDVYEVAPGKLKNEVTLDVLPSTLSGINTGYYGFKERIELPTGWSIAGMFSGNVSGLMNENLVIKNGQGEAILSIPAPVFFDNTGQSSDGAAQVNGSFFLAENAGVVELSTLVPVSWLKDAARQYPVVLDPTVVILTGMDGGWMSTNNLVNNPSYAFVGVCCGNLMHRAWIRFNTSVIPDGSNVTLTELELYCNGVGGSTAEQVWVNDVTGAHGPYPGINLTVYADLGDGPYVDYIATGTGTQPFFPLGAQADLDVAASLPTNFYQVALMFDNEPSTNWKRYVATSCRLRVTYGPVLLPAELSNFETTCIDNTTELSWTTESETNLDYFGLEKSEDGVNFTEFGTVESATNSTAAIDYNGTDANPYSGITYYRLRMVRLDGTVFYSGIRAVNCGKELGSVTIAPNPTNSTVQVEFVQNLAADVEILLMNNLGRVLKRVTVPAKIGANQHKLDLSEYPSGVYLLTIKDGGQQAIRKIIKE